MKLKFGSTSGTVLCPKCGRISIQFFSFPYSLYLVRNHICPICQSEYCKCTTNDGLLWKDALIQYEKNDEIYNNSVKENFESKIVDSSIESSTTNSSPKKKDTNFNLTRFSSGSIKSNSPSSHYIMKSSEVSFDGEEHILYICKGIFSCEKKHHQIIPATGILVSLHQTPVKINVNYCVNCRKYFISLNEYTHYQQKYGNLLGNYRFQNSTSINKGVFDGLAEKSVLNLCGYNVNEDDGLSTKERHLILENLMVHNIVSKPKIIDYLTFFINSKKNMWNMKSAVKKWTDDLEWVRQYRIDSQRRFLISGIKKFHQR